MKHSLPLLLCFLSPLLFAETETVATWTFDEPTELYPSHTLDTTEGLQAPLTLGLGGSVVPGKFGNALSTIPYPDFEIPEGTSSPGRAVEFGQLQLPVPEGKTQPPLSWHNADYAGFMTGGETHLRKEFEYANPTRTGFNLGDQPWTVEFWYQAIRDSSETGVVFEIGNGERGEEGNETLRLLYDVGANQFVLEQTESDTRIALDTLDSLSQTGGNWAHLAFVHDAARNRLVHYVNGKEVSRARSRGLRKLSPSDVAYMSLLRNGTWGQPLPGKIDELRFSRGALYTAEFSPPSSFAPTYPELNLLKGPPLLFAPGKPQPGIVPLGSRKHLFIDDALIESRRNITFTVNPPRLTHRVLDNIEGQFRKHLTFVEDEDGLIRMYNGGPDDYLMVHTSRDGIHFEPHPTGLSHKGRDNIVIPYSVAMGSPFIDPNGPPEHRWKYISGSGDRGTYLFTSPDGWNWKKVRTATHSFRSGSQTSFFYDAQRQKYVTYMRTGMTHTRGNNTQRAFIITETNNPFETWPLQYMDQEATLEMAKSRRLRDPKPWFLDNGPLVPGDFGIEGPIKFEVTDDFDPEGLGIYVPKAHKYPWAPDTYIAFPLMYFHYEVGDGPPERWVLYDESRGAGSGTVETQVAVSRDGRNWFRYPRPAYAGIGDYLGRYSPQAYFAEGMIRRGNEIWQYIYAAGIYHSTWEEDDKFDAVYRVVQRLDGFVSADAPYDHHGIIITRPLTFEGNRLLLNIDTDAAGYAQVGFLDLEGEPIPGFGIDNGVYINGDYIDIPAEFLRQDADTSTDLSALEGRPVKIIIRMRGAKLYSLQFVNHSGSDSSPQN